MRRFSLLDHSCLSSLSLLLLFIIHPSQVLPLNVPLLARRACVAASSVVDAAEELCHSASLRLGLDRLERVRMLSLVRQQREKEEREEEGRRKGGKERGGRRAEGGAIAAVAEEQDEEERRGKENEQPGSSSAQQQHSKQQQRIHEPGPSHASAPAPPPPLLHDPSASASRCCGALCSQLAPALAGLLARLHQHASLHPEPPPGLRACGASLEEAARHLACMVGRWALGLPGEARPLDSFFAASQPGSSSSSASHPLPPSSSPTDPAVSFDASGAAAALLSHLERLIGLETLPTHDC